MMKKEEIREMYSFIENMIDEDIQDLEEKELLLTKLTEAYKEAE